jgi:hypothetical protein
VSLFLPLRPKIPFKGLFGASGGDALSTWRLRLHKWQEDAAERPIPWLCSELDLL